MCIPIPGAVMERPPSGAHELQVEVPAGDVPAASPEARGEAVGERWHDFTVPPIPEAVGAARRRVVETLRHWDVDDTSKAVDSVRLIVSELVSNAVRHAGQVTSEVAVTMTLDARGDLRLGVRDGHPGRPRVRQVPLLACSGRGMDIVLTLLAEAGGRYGIEPYQDGGKTVWIQLSITSCD